MFSALGREVARRVKGGQVLGIGTGSTVDAVLVEIGRRISEEELVVYGVPTSRQCAWRCSELGIVVLDGGFSGEISWGFDGADAVTRSFLLIKGLGGAMLQEKILAARCQSYTILVDDTKLTNNISSVAIPVEVVPTAIHYVEGQLRGLGALEVAIRSGEKRRPIFTEAGNLILDAKFKTIEQTLEDRINAVVGVVENGLFTRFTTEVLIAREGGVERWARE